jgi:hypothetical protein
MNPAMLKSYVMDYSKSILLYQEQVTYGLPLKIIFMVSPAALVATSLYLWSSGEITGGIVLLVEAVFLGLIFLSIFPRKYQIYENHLRIVLGGPFSVKIGFDRITKIEVTSKTALTVNLVTRLAKTYVIIIRKGSIGIAITPKSYEDFVENANRALGEWIRTQGTTSQQRFEQ